jgi:phosphatidylglycerophosphate synthase
VAVSCDTVRANEAATILAGGTIGVGWTVETAEAPRFAYNEVLRKRAVPFVLDTRAVPMRDIEWRMFGASYKGATDFVTKWLWPVPAFHATRACAALGLSPNMVTLISFLLVIAAFALFANGQFAWGIAAAWPMTFLDTVDGKLARVTVTSSKWGNVFDHGIDMIHPPFWYWAWAMGLTAPAETTTALWIIVGGYVFGRLIEGVFIALFKFEMHVWRPFDFWLRTVTARRNPNLAILTIGIVLGAPGAAFTAVAGWTAICLALHLIRLGQSVVDRARGHAVESFLAAARPT